LENGGSAKALVESSGMQQLSDEGELTKIISEIIQQNPRQTEQFKAGKTNLKGYFVGETMKRTKGKASPEVVNRVLDKLLI
jgi:aspartyl-tRNA(Asn)/glutamyl-tRNA(Gln) amidotransferase subunit B